jgi:phosphatidylglycerophosphatase A
MIMPTDIWGQLGAFLLFRFFDAVKPGPIKTIDRYFKTWQPQLERLDQPKKIPSWMVRGFGVMIDDIAAAIATLLVIAIWVRVF